jgi:hypothetical protein
LADNIASVVGDSQEATSNALLEVRVFNPPDQVASANAHLVEVLEVDWFVDHVKILGQVFVIPLLSVIRFALVIAVRVTARIIFRTVNAVLFLLASLLLARLLSAPITQTTIIRFIRV